MVVRVLSRSMTTTGIRQIPRSANDHSRLSRFVVRQNSTTTDYQNRRPLTSSSAPASTASPTRSTKPSILNIRVRSVAEINSEHAPSRNIRSISVGRSFDSLYQRTGSATAFGGTYKVLEYLHCGSIESSMDASLLCRLHIAYIIGFLQSSDSHHNHRSLPCACPKLHQRVEMQLEIGDNDVSTPPDTIVACFDDVNKFIATARSQAKQVLSFVTTSSLSLASFTASVYGYFCICRCSYSVPMHRTAVKRLQFNISCSISECAPTMQLLICKRIKFAFN